MRSSERIPSRRHVGWVLFALTLFLFGAGLFLQFRNGTRFDGEGPPTFYGLLAMAAWCVWAFIGALIIFHKPGNPIGWLFAIVGVINGTDQFFWGMAYQGFVVNQGSLPGTELMIIWLYWVGVVLGIFPITLLFLFFPTGRAPSSRWRILIWLSAGATIIYMILAAIKPLPLLGTPFPTDLVADLSNLEVETLRIFEAVTWAAYVARVFILFAAIASLGYRFSRASGVERQQLKWFALATSLAIPGILLLILGLTTDFVSSPLISRIGLWILLLFEFSVAIASGVAILYYRLFDIDIIIRRTLTYSLLTGLLALFYFGFVVFLQATVGAAIGHRDSPIIIVITTLTIAALVHPLRRRLQDFIDRRFFRKKYDAQRILTRFAVTARDEVDLDELAGALLEAFEQTLEPETLSLWLIKSSARKSER